jgi:hypothetical protein
MNFGHTSVFVDILFKYWMSKYELFIFLWFLGVVLWDQIIQGSKFHSKKIVIGPRVSISVSRLTVAWPPEPNCQQMRCGFTNHRHQWHSPTRGVSISRLTCVGNDYPLSLIRSNSSQQISSSSQQISSSSQQNTVRHNVVRSTRVY